MRTTLLDYAAICVRLLDGSDGYSQQLQWGIRGFEKCRGQPLFIDELTAVFYGHYYDRAQAVDFPQPPSLIIVRE